MALTPRFYMNSLRMSEDHIGQVRYGQHSSSPCRNMSGLSCERGEIRQVTGSALREGYGVRNVVAARAFCTVLSDTQTAEEGQAYKEEGNEHDQRNICMLWLTRESCTTGYQVCLHTCPANENLRQRRRQKKAQKEKTTSDGLQINAVSGALVKVFKEKKDRPLRFNCKKGSYQRDEICVYWHPPHGCYLQKGQCNAVVKENHRARHAPPRSREKPLARGWPDTVNKTSLADKSVELCTVQSAILDRSRTRAIAKKTSPLVVSCDSEARRTRHPSSPPCDQRSLVWTMCEVNSRHKRENWPQ